MEVTFFPFWTELDFSQIKKKILKFTFCQRNEFWVLVLQGDMETAWGVCILMGVFGFQDEGSYGPRWGKLVEIRRFRNLKN